MEAEYIAASDTARSLIPIRGILAELDVTDNDFAFPMLMDNNSAIAASGGEKVSRNARHIDIKYHHIRDLVGKGVIGISYVPSSEMAADGFTKALDRDKFVEFRNMIGMANSIGAE